MNDRTARFTGFLAIGASAGLLVASGDAAADPKGVSTKRRAAVVSRLDVPLGLQGLRGAGPNVIIPFSLRDATRTPTDLNAQFGIDRNSDGQIAENEYFPASEDRLDSRDTRRNRKPQLFLTSGDIGATHAYAWRTTSDLGSERHEVQLYQFTAQGRLIPDPAHKGEFLFDDKLAGVRMRLRATRGKGKDKLTGAWAYTDAFSVNNNAPPSNTIDDVIANESGLASDEHVEILWTAFDADSEDKNGNGDFDPGEDVNGNRLFDQEQVGVAFDYYRLQPGDDPASMSDAELGTLTWEECTRVQNEGNTDSFHENDPSLAIYGSPNGRQWKFVWNSLADVGSVNGQYIVRARPIDAKRENGDFAYRRTPFTVDNWKVFTSGAGGTADIALAAGRVGCTATNLVYGLEQSDPLYGSPFQQVIVAGGSTSRNGNGGKNVTLFLVNSETADTVGASKIALTMSTARKYHTATMLSDGRVLFAGGFDDAGNPTATTEIYDPKTRTISAGPSLNTARARHTAVLLNTNDVAFIGGVGAFSTLLNSVEIYRFTAAGQAELPVETLPQTLTVAQHSAKALVLPDRTSGAVLIAGGITGAADEGGAATQTAYILDPLAGPVATGTFGAVKAKTPTITETASMLSGRKFASATALIDGNVLFAGGQGPVGPLSSMEIYNWQTRTFEAVDLPMPDGGRSQHVAALMGDGSVLLAGGATADPSLANVTVSGKADVFVPGARTGTTWTGTFTPVNGDMVIPRRDAAAAVIMSGRPFIVGGLGGTGSTVAICEAFTPEGSRNTAPKSYVLLPSDFLSHRIGAPIYYRLVDAEEDQARVIAQFRHPLETVWHACTPQPTTFVGDVAEDTANLRTTTFDNPGDVLSIDPLAQGTPQRQGDHIFIWNMEADIDRPDVGDTIPGYTIRVTPFGAVRGEQDVTAPVNVLYNTKVITALFPLEDAPGVPNPVQGGDVAITVHIRDIDGPGAGPRIGDPCDLYFTYAVDANFDGQIAGSAEAWIPMTPAGAPYADLVPATVPQVAGVASWSEAAADSDPSTRDPAKGWHTFQWDALYDLGRPLGPTYQQRNVWIQAVAQDANIGFPKVLRNALGYPDQFVYVRDAGALWLESFAPRVYAKNAVRTNEPVDFTFNGNIEPGTAKLSTLKIYRGTLNSQVLGAYQVQNDVTIVNGVATASPGRCTVTFHPQAQDYDLGAARYSVSSVPNTVLFPSNEYRISIPAYAQGTDPKDTTTETLRPLGYAGGALTSTFQIVNSMSVDGDTELAFRFTTAPAGSLAYLDSQPVGFVLAQGASPTLPGPAATSGFTMTYNHAIDVATVLGTAAAPNILVRGSLGPSYVVPGRWTVRNTVNSDGTSSAVLTFVPLMKLPAGDRIAVSTGAGLKGTNGTSASPLGVNATFDVAGTPRPAGTATSQTETFTTALNNDTSYAVAGQTLATWGTDPCSGGGNLTGSQDGSVQPNPTTTTDLIVKAGLPQQLQNAAYDYRDIIVEKNAVLTLRSTTAGVPIVLRANRNITIDGTIDFAGLDGDTGASNYQYSGFSYAVSYTTTVGTATGVRKGGIGYNGGGSGGNSVFSSADFAAGLNGPAPGAGAGGTASQTTGAVPGGGGGGQGGQLQTQFQPRYTTYYYYGAAGGAGGGHARVGIAGGAAFTTSAAPGPTNPMSVGGTAATLAADFSSGISAGGGGGGGASMQYSSTYYYTAGAGGAGAGGLQINCNGLFKLSGSGYINGRGGEGGTKGHYSGAGGGGAGGAVWIKAGGGAQLDGLIDLRGGRGGPTGLCYYADSYAYVNSNVYGTPRYGGDGAPGRLVVEAPNYLPGKTDQVRVFGAMVIRKVAIPTTSISTTSIDSTWGSSAGGAITFPGRLDTRYGSSLTIGANSASVIKLRNRTGVSSINGTVQGNTAARIWVDGDVTINGTLQLSGNGMVNTPATAGTDYEPFTSTALTQYFETASTTYVYYTVAPYCFNVNNTGLYTSGFSGVLGGGDGGNAGGKGAGASTGYIEPFPGSPPTATPTVTTTGGGYKFRKTGSGVGWGGTYGDCGDVSGAGAGNASAGSRGWPMYGANDMGGGYTGFATDSSGNGVTAATSRANSSVGGGVADAAAISTTNFMNFAGSGGGAGSAGAYYNSAPTSYYYCSLAAFGGGGGGALAIIATGTIDVRAGARIEARGGDGVGPGVSYGYGIYNHAGGGGGSGGTVYLAANVVTIAPAASEVVTSGATFDMRGGYGGGWRQHRAGTPSAYPMYNTFSNFGGDGGFGRLVIDYNTSLNGGNALVNKWGNEQSVFADSSNQYRAMAGQSTFKCRGVPGGIIFRSTFMDLGSLRPLVTQLSLTSGGTGNNKFTLQGQGAQSDPHAVGAGGTGTHDAANVGVIVNGPSNPSTSTLLSYDGWRWWRFLGTIERLTSPGSGQPVLDDIKTWYTTDP